MFVHSEVKKEVEECERKMDWLVVWQRLKSLVA